MYVWGSRSAGDWRKELRSIGSSVMWRKEVKKDERADMKCCKVGKRKKGEGGVPGVYLPTPSIFGNW